MPETPTTLTLQVAARVDEARDVVVLVLADPQGADLPPWEPGAHLDLHIDQPGSAGLVRQYSLCGSPDDRKHYRIAVLRSSDGRGASRHIHDSIRTGQLVRVSPPRNLFRFETAERVVFVAGGIGITPILPMVERAGRDGTQWELHYAGRAPESMAFAGPLRDRGDNVHLYPSSSGHRMPVADVVGSADGAVIYACGPASLLSELEQQVDGCGSTLHTERFDNDAIVSKDSDQPFDVEMSLTGRTVTVNPGQSILEAVTAAGVPALSSCQGGTCGTCETFVVEGEPDHRDAVLNAQEREESEVMMICVSRCKGSGLTLEL